MPWYKYIIRKIVDICEDYAPPVDFQPLSVAVAIDSEYALEGITEYFSHDAQRIHCICKNLPRRSLELFLVTLIFAVVSS